MENVRTIIEHKNGFVFYDIYDGEYKIIDISISNITQLRALISLSPYNLKQLHHIIDVQDYIHFAIDITKDEQDKPLLYKKNGQFYTAKVRGQNNP